MSITDDKTVDEATEPDSLSHLDYEEEHPLLQPPSKFRVRDGSRMVAFEGTRLAYVTSQKPDSLRWTEMDIYRTTGGRFIAHRVGVSCVAHTVDCEVIKGKTLPSVVDMQPDEFGVDDREPCPVCRPDIRQGIADDPASIRGETDRPWAGVCDDAYSLINALHTRRNGTRSLSSLASALLAMAAENDAQISAALDTDLEV
jgi:hypothetical protein